MLEIIYSKEFTYDKFVELNKNLKNNFKSINNIYDFLCEYKNEKKVKDILIIKENQKINIKFQFSLFNKLEKLDIILEEENYDTKRYINNLHNKILELNDDIIKNINLKDDIYNNVIEKINELNKRIEEQRKIELNELNNQINLLSYKIDEINKKLEQQKDKNIFKLFLTNVYQKFGKFIIFLGFFPLFIFIFIYFKFYRKDSKIILKIS